MADPKTTAGIMAKPCRCGKMAEAACNAMPNDWECGLEVPVTKPSHLRADKTTACPSCEPAWRANERLNERAEICYQALEQISKRHPNSGTTGDIARDALEAAANVQ